MHLFFPFLAMFFLLSTSTLAAQSALTTSQQDSLVQLSDDELVWMAGPQGREIAILYGDPTQEGHFVMRVRFPAHHKIERHWHPTAEFATLLSGTAYFAFGEGASREDATEFGPGSFFAVPAGIHIVGWTGEEEVVVQGHGQGPFEIILVEE